MIDEALRPPVPRRPGRRWRRWLAVLALIPALTAGFLVVRRLHPADSRPVAAVPSSLPASPPLESTPAPSASPAPDLSRLPRYPGKVPARGSGTFRYAAGGGPVLGAAGPVRRFRVGVENGTSEDVEEFAAQVQTILGDPRGWTGGGTLRLRWVPAGEPYDFTVYLATRDTAGRMCQAGGTNIAIDGRPYTSCRTTGKAIINLDRWRLSAAPYLTAHVPLATYRQYVINHEVGHELGHQHAGCPKAGGPAPVMVQQTITLRGCAPNPWPRLGDHFLTGPPV